MEVDSSSSRRWYQLHASSWFWLALAIVLLLAVNLPYEYGTVSTRLSSPLFDADQLDTEIRFGGWPFRYLSVRTPKYAESAEYAWSTAALAGDVLVAMLVLAVVVGGYEWRRRRRTLRWQLSLSDLCFLMLAVCSVFGTWNIMAHHYRTQQQAIQLIREHHGHATTRLFLPKLIIGPSERSPSRDRFHAWLTGQLWYYERPSLARLSTLNDDSMAGLRQLREIETLVVADSNVTDERIAALASLRNLERLQIDGEPLTDACIPSLQRLAHLRYLRIRNASFSDDAIAKLAALPNLVSLDVEGSPLTDRGLAKIAGCQQLRELNIAWTQVSERGLRLLDGHPKLTRLWLAGAVSTLESPAVKRVQLNNLPLLETLHLPSHLDSLELSNLPSLTQFPSGWEHNAWWRTWQFSRTYYGFGADDLFPRPMLHGVNAKHLSLGDLPRLTRLTLDIRKVVSLELDVTSLLHLSTIPTNDWRRTGATRIRYDIDDQRCEWIGRNKGLQSLSLVDASLTRYGWKQLSSLRDLRSLDLTGSNVTDEDLGSFSGAYKLQTLDLAETQITNRGWDKLPRFGQLQTLDLSGTRITRLNLEDLPELNSLIIADMPLALLRLKDLPKLAGNLVVASPEPLVVEAVNLPAIGGIYLPHQCIERMTLKNLASLSHLDLTSASVDDATLRDLGRWTSLHSLILRDTEITDKTLSRIGDFQELRRLDVENTMITDEGLAALSPQLPLSVLNLTGTNISDRGLRHLSGQKHLTHLYLGRTGVCGPGLQHLSNVASLQKLSLGVTDVTSDSVAHLQNLRNLEWLRLSDTKIDDGAFQHLTRLTNLRSLFLNGTSVTDEGVSTFELPRPLKVLDISNSGVTAYRASSIAESRRSLKVLW